MADRPPHAAPRRAMAAILVFQLGLGAFLFAGDLQGGFRLPTGSPEAPDMDQPVRPGDQTRRYAPDRPRTDLPATGPLPERLVLTRIAGGRWLLEGTIASGDADRIIGRMSEIADLGTLRINSPGGSVQDALKLGRQVRRLGLATLMTADDVCLSACPYLLAAGVERRIADGAMVGVHQHYFGESTLLPAFVAVEDIQRGQGEVMGYLSDMGIDLLLMRHALTTPPDEIYLLVPEELERYGLATETLAALGRGGATDRGRAAWQSGAGDRPGTNAIAARTISSAPSPRSS